LYNMADYHIDAKNKILGRLASDISLILQGKKSASYNPRVSGTDRVYVENYKDVRVTGKKETQKIYYHHTGYVGHLKELKYEEVKARDPKRIIRQAVRKMLPRNFLTQKRLNRLYFMEGKGK